MDKDAMEKWARAKHGYKYNDVPVEEVQRFFQNYILNPDPFTAVTNCISMLEASDRINPITNASVRSCIKLFKEFFFMAPNLAKAKIVQIDKDLLPSIIHTDNEVFFRNTGLPVMFINEDFKYKNHLIKGILVINTPDLYSHMDPGMMMELWFKHPNSIDAFQDLTIMILAIDDSSGVPLEDFICFSLMGKTYKGDENINLQKYVSTLVCNILDFMNHDTETITINTIIKDDKVNEKRIKRGKPPIPTKVHIRPKSEFRNYYVSFNADLDTRHFSHRFLVRGHWRHYRADRFVNKSGKSVWIKPFIKGKGIFVEKKYKLEGGEQDA